MYRVLVDTSVWLNLAGNPKRFPELAILEQMVRRRVIELIVPTLAILEFHKNRANFIHRAETELLPHAREIRKAALRLGGPEKKVTAFLEQLDHLTKQTLIAEGGPGQALDRIESLLLASPTIERSAEIIDAAVQRGLDKRAPFCDRNGMADAILLETYAQCLRENLDPAVRFAFVTNDKDDFSEPQGNHNRPHPDIAELFTPGKSYFFIELLAALNQFDHAMVTEVLARDEPTVADLMKQYMESASLRPGVVSILRMLSRMPIAAKKASKLKPSDYLEHIEHRRKTAGPSTVMQDVTYMNSVFKWALQNISVDISTEALERAKQSALKRGLISKSEKATARRLSLDDEERLARHFLTVKKKVANLIDNMVGVMQFAIWSTRRVDEICNLRWEDFDEVTKTCKVRNVHRTGRDLTFRLVGAALEIVLKQREAHGKGELIFPYNAKSIGARFRRAKEELGIDIIFDDLRDEGIWRLFESGKYPVGVIQEVAGDPKKVWAVKEEFERRSHNSSDSVAQ